MLYRLSNQSHIKTLFQSTMLEYSINQWTNVGRNETSLIKVLSITWGKFGSKSRRWKNLGGKTHFGQQLNHVSGSRPMYEEFDSTRLLFYFKLLGKVTPRLQQILVNIIKAFDTVDNSILTEKLRWYGIKGIFLTLDNQFLFWSSTSRLLLIICGVPQWCILGPLLFWYFFFSSAT